MADCNNEQYLDEYIVIGPHPQLHFEDNSMALTVKHQGLANLDAQASK